jgi:heavy metal translocating P-type ATPase
LLGAPIALISGMSRAAKQGIIVKTGSAMERLAEVQTVAFDKTGTLTVGKPTVDKVEAFGKFKEKQILNYAAALELSSNHVLASAIVAAAADEGVKVQKAKQVKEVAGHGLSGRFDGHNILIGRFGLLQEHNIQLPKGFRVNTVKQTATFIAVDNELAGVIKFKDTIRPEAKDTLRRLKKSGVKHTAMVTGDNEATALSIAKELNIVDVYPECLPADKLAAIDQMEHYPIAFVGDGVNDAPVLTASDVGIALGARGSTAASESADVVILHDDVSKVAQSVEIAQRTFFIAKQSILIGIFISLGLMAVFATGKFKPVYGALLQEVVDVAVILNALRAHGSFKMPGKFKRSSRKKKQS